MEGQSPYDEAERIVSGRDVTPGDIQRVAAELLRVRPVVESAEMVFEQWVGPDASRMNVPGGMYSALNALGRSVLAYRDLWREGKLG